MKRIAFIFLCLLLSGCNAKEEAKNFAEMVSISKNAVIKAEEDRNVFVGADISEDVNVKSIGEFEDKCGKHQVYADEFLFSETEKIEKFILECYSQDRIPYIVLKYDNNAENRHFEKQLSELAEVFNRYKVQFMVEIFFNGYYDKNGEKYDFITERLKNPNAVFVGSVEKGNAVFTDILAENADIVCVNGYFENAGDVEKTFNALKNTDKKIILRYGAKYFSSSDCTYRAHDMEEAVKCVYNGTAENENIVGVIYMDKNRRTADRAVYADYSITSEEKIRKLYRELVRKTADL